MLGVVFFQNSFGDQNKVFTNNFFTNIKLETKFYLRYFFAFKRDEVSRTTKSFQIELRLAK